MVHLLYYMDSLHLFSFFNKIFFIMLHLSTFLFLLLSCQNNNIGNKIENSISYEIQELRLDSPEPGTYNPRDKRGADNSYILSTLRNAGVPRIVTPSSPNRFLIQRSSKF